MWVRQTDHGGKIGAAAKQIELDSCEDVEKREGVQ